MPINKFGNNGSGFTITGTQQQFSAVGLVKKIGYAMTGGLDTSGNCVTEISDPLLNPDVSTKKYVDTSSATSVRKCHYVWDAEHG